MLTLSDCQEYLQLDWIALARRMCGRGRVFDTRHGTNLEKAMGQGLETWQIGRGGMH